MSIKSINDELVKLGRKPQSFRTLKQAQLALEAAKSGRAIKPSFSKPVMVAKPAPAAKAPIVAPDAIASLKAAAKAARTGVDKAAAFQKLSEHLTAEMAKETDFAKKAELSREYMASEKARGYSLLAARVENPGAEKIQRYLDAANRD